MSSRISIFSNSVAVTLAIILLSGCAAQRTYNEGKDLASREKIEDALGKFQSAMAQDPKNFEYRIAYMQTRSRAIDGFLERADRLAAAEKLTESEALYK